MLLWLAGATFIGVSLAEMLGHGHGSILYVILALYAGIAGAAVHLLILAVRSRRT